MKTVRLGRTGLKVSEICLGTMTFGYQCDEKTSFAIMTKAAEGGVDFIDTADVYPVPPSLETSGRTEEIVGRWLVGQRDRFVLATKCRMKVGPGPNDEGLLAPPCIMKAAEDSLRAGCKPGLHRPVPTAQLRSRNTYPTKRCKALDDLVRQGKVRYLGCSNYPAWRLALALGASAEHGWERFDLRPAALPISSIATSKRSFYRFAAIKLPRSDRGYNPLAGGFLTGEIPVNRDPAG